MGFYWRFGSHADLLQALLEDWRETNIGPMLAALAGPGDPDARFARLARLWVDGRGFSSAYDAAVREWGRGDAAVRAVVQAWTTSGSARCAACSSTMARARTRRWCARASPITIRSAIMRSLRSATDGR